MKDAEARGTSPFLDVYLPLDRRWALAQGRQLPERSWGTILFADLSGFTPLMEHLSNTLGPQQGAEELTHLLNALFTPLIGEVHTHGGSIVAFGGDALTCWFPALTPPLPTPAGGRGEVRAAACALAMQRHVAGLGAVETPAGAVRFSMHIGLASGELRRFCVGQPPHGLCDVLAGAAVDTMAEAQHRAGTGQVVVDAATAAHLPEDSWRPLDEGFALLSAMTIEASALSPTALAPCPALPTPQVRRWLAEPLYRRLRASRGGFSAELRLVTSVFVQFAGLDYDGDPGVGEKLQAYVARVQELLAPYKGYLDLVSCGDKGSLLFILFGAPTAHEDDPVRAVGFALEVQEAVKALPFIQGQRIGISLGRVYAGILGSSQRCTYTVLGDEVNVSARLMQAAAAGQVLVSQRVQQAAAGSYTFRSLGSVAVKGKEEPVPIFEPQEVQEHRPMGEEEPLVGREHEEGTLTDLLAGLEGGHGHLLLILGQAGVGKSALVRFLLRQVRGRGWPVHVGACLSYGQSTPYLPWRAIVEQVCGLTVETGPAERAVRLEEAVAALPAPADRPDYWRARFPLLAAAMGLEVPDTPLTRSLEGELRRDNTFQLLEVLVRHLAAEGPAVVILEDAYWADELSLSLAAQIGRGLADLPLLLVLVHRPFTEPVPATVRALQAVPRQTVLALTALGQDSSSELARQRLHGAALPAQLEALLQERAQGNPFFIEELLRALQEAGYLRRRAGTVELTGAWEALSLPDTIEGVVRARMDRLPEGERLTLKVAAVIGRTFERPLLQEVHPGRPARPVLGRQLTHLGQADFTQLEEEAPQWRYAFRHPILHEVTYETLLFAQRRQLHGIIGAVLEAWYGGELPRVLDLLAHHYARSEEREKAVYYLQRAGEKARREYANEVALGYYSQALERLLPEEVELRYDLLSGRERIHDLLGERGAQEQDLREMAGLAEALADPRRQVEVLNRQARRAADMGAFEEGQSLVRAALAMAGQAENRLGLAEAYRVSGILQANLGEYEGAQAAFQRALEIFRALNHREGESTSLNNLGLLSDFRGDLEQALQFYQQALQITRQLGDRRREGHLLINLGLTYRGQGDYGRARLYCEQAMAILQEIGDLPVVGIAFSNIGAVAMAQGDLAAARSCHLQALGLARRLEHPEGEATSLVSIGILHIYAQEFELARRHLRAALRLFRRIGHRWGRVDTLHNLGVLELQSGRVRAAARLLRETLALWQEIGDAKNALVTRAWLGRACLAAGEGEQARACLEQVRTQLDAEGYGGAYPEQEVWWAAHLVWQGCGEEARAREALERAHRLVQEQAGRIADPALQQSFLERVPVNREIEEAWRRRECR